jgi:hypothetical protein
MKLSQLFAAEPALQPLMRRLAEVDNLERIYSEAAPRALAGLSRVGSFEKGTLTILTDNGAVAAKLRQHLPRLTQAFVLKGAKVTDIRLVVQVEALAGDAARPNQRKPMFARGAAESCRQAAANLADSPLRTALERLARRRGPRT